MEAIRNLLRAVTFQIPPSTGQYHSITLDVETGGLILILGCGKLFYPVTLEDSDFARPAKDVAEEIARMTESVIYAH